nr:HAD hydrolase-like protein [Marinicella sp. W31]MDC2876693.1 HAD hydrolase-like protein [Marinicella sp. W31]
MSSPLVIFDLDGTLIDTAPDLIESLNHAIAPAGLAPFDISQLHQLVGKGVKVMIERASRCARPISMNRHSTPVSIASQHIIAMACQERASLTRAPRTLFIG